MVTIQRRLLFKGGYYSRVVTIQVGYLIDEILYDKTFNSCKTLIIELFHRYAHFADSLSVVVSLQGSQFLLQ